MKNERYYWLKIYDDFFTSTRIKKLRKIAGGDTYIVIYLKMQLIAMKQDGVLRWKGVEDKFADELALELDEDPANVEVTISYLVAQGMAEFVNDTTLFLPFAVKNVGSECSSAQRVRECRARAADKKELPCEANKSEIASPGNAELLHCNTDIRDKREDIREDITISNEIVCRTSDVRRVIEAWNDTGLTQVTKITADTNRGKMLKARIRENGVEGVLKAIENVKNSAFLKGQNNRGFEATFDWFVKPNNFLKVLEGNYTDKKAAETDWRTSEAYQIAEYLAREKAKDNPGRAWPTDAEMQRQAEVLEELHTQSGVAWDTIDNVLYFALDSQWWSKKVQSAHDLKWHFNEIYEDMTKEQGAVKED